MEVTCMAGGHVWQVNMHGRGHTWQGACMHGRECVWQRVCIAGGRACMAGETTIAADGTHPTGMHSCY